MMFNRGENYLKEGNHTARRAGLGVAGPQKAAVRRAMVILRGVHTSKTRDGGRKVAFAQLLESTPAALTRPRLGVRECITMNPKLSPKLGSNEDHFNPNLNSGHGIGMAVEAGGASATPSLIKK